MDAKYIAFLVNFFEPAMKLPVSLLPGMILRRSTEAERKAFEPYNKAAHFDREDNRITRTRIPFGTGPVRTETNEDFQGYVIQFSLREWARYGKEHHPMFDRLELACSVAEAGLRPVLVCEIKTNVEPLFFTHDLHRHSVLRRRSLGSFLKRIPRLTAGDLEEIRDLVTRIRNLPPAANFVLEAMDRFKQVELISYDSDFHIFGLFTIVEYLLTHAPRLEDRSDSLTKQISAKCPAINQRFPAPVVLADFFEPMTDEKGWKILYSYRSAIAHGGRIDFRKTYSKSDYRQLRSRDAVFAYLHQFTQRLLKYTLCEPKSVSDLKAA
jgi:hypothetical protein